MWTISRKLYESLHCSRGLAEEFSPDSFSDGEQSVPLSMNPTPDAYLSRDRTTDSLSHSQYGMKFVRLTERLGEVALTWFLEDFPARTSAQPEGAQELPESEADFGWKWPESWVKYNPVSCSWKTRQHSLLGDWVEFSETWPRWGSMRNGECWGLPMWERRTSETESGYWPTPTSSQGGPNHGSPQVLSGNHGINLQGAVMHRMWPTPTVCGNHNRKGASKTSGDGLATAVKQRWTTPTAHMAKETNAPSESTRNTPTLTAQAGGTLNPNWVEWLMGWPIGHTDLKPSETAKCQPVRLKHGAG
jgi:hypothetical protein